MAWRHNLPAEDAEQRKQRQFAMLHAIADSSMTFAEEAAEQVALQNEAEANDPAAAPPKGAPDHHRRFIQHASNVRQIIALEMRLESGHAEPRARKPAGQRVPVIIDDPRQALLQTELHRAVQHNPARAQLRRSIDQRIEEELLADPGRAIRLEDIFNTLSAEFRLPIDHSKTTDEFLDFDDPDPNFLKKSKPPTPNQ